MKFYKYTSNHIFYDIISLTYKFNTVVVLLGVL